MGIVPLRVDTSPFWQLGLAAGLAAALLFVGIVVGAAGPSPNIDAAHQMYRCPQGSHIWDAAKCNGTQLGAGNLSFSTSLGPHSARNRFWALSMTPYMRLASPLPDTDTLSTMKVTLAISVYHRGDPHGPTSHLSQKWEPYSTNEHHIVDFRCHTRKYQGMCKAIGVAYEQSISNPFHEIKVVPTVSQPGLLGDVVFTAHWGNVKWTDLSLAFNVVFMVIALAAFLCLLFALRKYESHDWHFEQGGILILSFLLLFYNNPFLAISYLVPGWFLLFLGSLCKTIFIATLLMFWLLLVDKIRDPEHWKLFGKRHIPKLVVVVAFFLCAVTAFTWSNIRDYADPVFGQEDMISGVVVFQSLSGVCVVFISIWILVLLAMSAKHIIQTRNNLTRFVYIVTPSLLVGIAVLIGAFVQGWGANNNQTMETLFYGSLYNGYIWMLSFAVWPSACAHRVGNPRVEADDESSADPVSATEAGEAQRLIK